MVNNYYDLCNCENHYINESNLYDFIYLYSGNFNYFNKKFNNLVSIYKKNNENFLIPFSSIFLNHNYLNAKKKNIPRIIGNIDKFNQFVGMGIYDDYLISWNK